MDTDKKNQWKLFTCFLLFYALLVILSYTIIPVEQLLPAGMQVPPTQLPLWMIGLMYAAIILVVYGLAGAAGYWFARRLGLPGIYRPGAGWRSWLITPMLFGIVLGIFFVFTDQFFAAYTEWDGFPHPRFPFSIIASATAGIGEEIIFRSFILGLWAFLTNLVLRRWKATRTALWIGIVIAALAVSASHLPSAMLLLGAATLGEIPGPILLELLVLNGVLGLVAGERYTREGLVSAIGIHFWADIVWHVIWPLVGKV